MKKNFYFIFIILCCIIGITAGVIYRSYFLSQTNASVITDIALSLEIPSIHVRAAVESVGLDNHGQMGVPKNTNDVAWYNLGPQPGGVGNAVIDGHVDTQTGAPAIFANLKQLKVGDRIEVTERNNIKHEFVVTSVEDLPTKNFPIKRVFGSTSDAHLNLITCDGVWDDTTNNYTQRLVVFTSLIK